MLCMSGDAGSVGLLWRRTDSGGICRVVYVWACVGRENAVEEGGIRWYPLGCECPGMRNLTWWSHAGKKPRTGGITVRSRFGYSRYYCAQARAHGRLKHSVQGLLQVGDDIVGVF